MQPPSRLAFYEERLVCLWNILTTTLGFHTVRVLLDSRVRGKVSPLSPPLRTGHAALTASGSSKLLATLMFVARALSPS
jgi:hypothetical protein